MTKQGDTITYKGVVTDGPKVATPYTRNITIVLAPDRTTGMPPTYKNTISQQETEGITNSWHTMLREIPTGQVT